MPKGLQPNQVVVLANAERQSILTTEQSPQSESDAMSVEPDGFIEVVYLDPEAVSTRYYFTEWRTWYWSKNSTNLIIQSDTWDGRVEIPAVVIREVVVHCNGPKYTTVTEMEEAAKHVIELQHHLDQAEAKFDEKRRAWHATS